MPITKELKNIQKLESVGFNHKQAEALADIIEQAQDDTQQGLKEFIRNELERKITPFQNEVNAKFEKITNEFNIKFEKITNEFNIKFEKIISVTDNIDTHIKAGQYDLLIKIFAIVTGTSGILFALLKLFG